MNTIVADVLMHEAAKARTKSHALAFIALFCGVGLIVGLAMAALGVDLGAGFF